MSDDQSPVPRDKPVARATPTDPYCDRPEMVSAASLQEALNLINTVTTDRDEARAALQQIQKKIVVRQAEIQGYGLDAMSTASQSRRLWVPVSPLGRVYYEHLAETRVGCWIDLTGGPAWLSPAPISEEDRVNRLKAEGWTVRRCRVVTEA